MYRISLADGSLVWSSAMPGSSGLASAVTVSSTGTAFVGDAGLRVYAVDDSTGACASSPALPPCAPVACARTLAAVLPADHGASPLVSCARVVGGVVDACAGHVQWSCAATGAVLGAPAVDPSGTVVFFTSTDTYVWLGALRGRRLCMPNPMPMLRRDVRWSCGVSV